MNPPFMAGDMVILDVDFGNKIGGNTYVVQGCHANDDCDSGWIIYITGWAWPIDSNWFKKKYT